jgi:hypothetical protein
MSPVKTILRTVVLTIAIGSLLAVGPAASAHGSWPYHLLGPTYCEQGRMLIYPPSQMRSSLDIPGGRFPPSFERVWWSPELLRYDARRARWRVVFRGGWYFARANNEGLVQNTHGHVWNVDDHNTLAWVPVPIRRPGRYHVRHRMMWPAVGNGQHRHGGIVCRYSA